MKTIQELNERRKEMGLTYSELSGGCGVPVPTLQKIFSGTTASPRFSTLRKIESALFLPSEIDDGIPAGRKAAFEHVFNEEAFCVRESVHSYGSAAEKAAGSVPANPDEWPQLLLKPQGTFTIADYEKIPEGERYELIDGMLIRLEAPTAVHQALVVFLSTQLSRLAENESCRCLVLCAPFDVQLDRDKKTMVQPDVLVICDENNFNKKRGLGAPDLCIEILSPSTRGKDQLLKRYKYERAGVREFWAIDPEYRRITVYAFEQGNETVYSFDDKVPVGICPGGHSIDFSKSIPAILRGV